MVVLVASGLATAVGSPASAQQPAVAAASTPGVILSTAKVIAPEQGTAAYTVRLATTPAADVTVTLTRNSDGDTDIAFDTDSGTSGDQDTLTFTSTTWNTNQQVTVAAADDTDKLYGTATITHTATSTDSNYTNKTADLAVSEGDNDVCQGTAAVNNATTGGLVNDCNTLLAAKATLAGTAALSPDWATGTPIATWQGITTANNRVTRLILTKQSLDGIIPNTLANLTGLTRLFLNQNSLTGPIPPSLGNLANLTRLYLDRNSLTGPIPPELGNLTNLTHIYLDLNSLTGTIPIKLTEYPNIRALGLSRNELTGTIPTQIGNLTTLTSLSLGGNELTGTIPTQIGNLTRLRGLYLWDNELTGTIPTQIGNLTNLTNLLLNTNSLSGSIPTQIGNLTKLIALILHDNSLSGSIPTEIGNLTKMYDLILNNNKLSGAIPAGIGNFTNPNRIHLQNNELTGSIPKELGNLAKLRQLALEFNDLSGSIPKELGDLANLTWLFLNDNDLTGSIPKELGDLANLTNLRLQKNQLTGSIPKELGNLANLHQIYLNDNDLTDSIPDELGNLVPGVTNSNFRNNMLSGCIPPVLAGYSGVINPQQNSQNQNVNLPVCVGIRLSKGSLDVSEGSQATYTVRLTSTPSADVTVTLTKAGDNDIAFDTDSVAEGNQATLTFTSATWGTAQTVTLSAAVDAVHDGEAATITHTAASADVDYDNKTTELVATEVDATPVLAAGAITDTSATLAIAKHSGDWYYRANTGPDAACKGPVSAAAKTLSGLAPGTSYVYTAHSAGGCGSASLLTTAGAFTTLALTGGEATGTTARLTLANHSGSWHYKSVLTDDEDFHADAGTCSSVVTGPTTTLQGLKPATQYIYKAYLDGGCRAELATTPIFSTAGIIVRTDSPPTAHEGETYSYQVSLATKPAAAVTVQITSDNSDITFTSEKSENTALTFTADNWSNRQDVAVNTSQDADTDDDISTIAHAAASTDDNQNSLSATLAFRVVDDDNALEASSVTADSATLTISGHVATWYYQADAAPHTTCQGPVSSSPTKALTGLSASTHYTYKAYSDNSCAIELTTDDSDAEFITAAAYVPLDTTPVLTAGAITDTSAALAIAKHSGDWYYRANTGPDAACKGPVSTTAKTLSGLAPGTSYVYTAHSAGGCGSASLLTTAGAFTTLALTGGEATGTTARLTLANHSGSWHYKSVLTDDEDFHADAGTCSSVVTGPTTTLQGLKPATQYIYKAYLDGGCRAELATTPIFSTAGIIVRTDSPPTAHEGETYSYQVSLATKPAAAVTVQITSDNSDITFTSEKSENTALTFTADNWSNRQDVAVNTSQDADTDDDISTIAHAAASTDDNQNSLSATLAFRVVDDDNALEASSVTADSATLTISGHVATWYYQADAAPHTTCQGPVSSSPTKALTGLSASTHYTYKAYSDNSCAIELTTDDSDAEFITAAAYVPPDTTSPVTSPPIGGPSTPSGPSGSSPPASPTDPTTPADPETFYSGAIDGPDYCTNLSLGGPRTYPYDSSGDGIADVCSLPYTRREAIARQNALDALAKAYPSRYATLLAQACGALANTDYGDHPDDLAQDACAAGASQPYTAPDPADPQTFYSGAIDGPDYCTNLSLGGPRTYPYDSNGDGIADVCSLPYTRREAIARQNALDALADNYPGQYAQLLAKACGALANTDYGDHPDDLAQDTCAT